MFAGRSRKLKCLASTLALGALSSCAVEEGRHASVSVQVCMADPKDVDAFLEEIRDASQRANLDFLDSSQEGAAMVADAQPHVGDLPLSTGRYIEFQAWRSELGAPRFGVVGGNLALPSNQAVVGVFYGKDKIESARFASDLIRRLSLRWDVEILPETRGGLPKEKCNPPSLVVLQ
jgi:hypothetical protein